MKLPKIASAVFFVAAAAACSFFTLEAAARQARPYGDVQVLSTFPADPGFPEGIAVKGNKIYVSGPARFGTAGTGPSTVVAYNRDTGATEATYTTQGEALQYEHANSCIAFDGHGSLLATNHAFATGIPENFTVLDVYVGDKGSPLSKPDLP